MKITVHDFNGADMLFDKELAAQWGDISDVLTSLYLQLKPSDQSSKQGSPIFDPVASNAVIKSELQQKAWPTNIVIPAKVSFLGTNVDFLKGGVLVEVQFSNYPFFLNNVVRSGLLAKSKTVLDEQVVRAVVIITKAHMFPSSNSTLYCEQAVQQLTEFTKHGMFEMPIRVVGLCEEVNTRIQAVWNNYPGRYSRTPSSSENIECKLTFNTRKKTTCSIAINPPR